MSKFYVEGEQYGTYQLSLDYFESIIYCYTLLNSVEYETCAKIFYEVKDNGDRIVKTFTNKKEVKEYLQDFVVDVKFRLGELEY